MKKLPTLNPFLFEKLHLLLIHVRYFLSVTIIVKVRFRLFGLQVDRDLCFFCFLVLRDTDYTKLCLIFYFLGIDLHVKIG